MGFEVGTACAADVGLMAEWAAAEGWNPGRTVGLDGVLDQQENYGRSGFRRYWTSMRFEGAATEVDVPPGVRIADARGIRFDALAAFDRRYFGVPRDAFLAAWISLPERIARVALRDDEIVGFAVLRDAQAASRIGPLFATDQDVASALVAELARGRGAASVAIDVPGINARALDWARASGLSPSFETARMYTGAPPAIDVSGFFGITSLELG